MKASEFRALIKEQVKHVLSEALNAVDSKLLTHHETLTPAVYRNLMLNARKGILKHMTQPDGKIHFWNPATKEYVAKLITYNGKGEYLYSNAIDKAGNLVEGINEATSIQKDLASKIHNAIESDEANKRKILNAMHKTQSQFNPLTVKIATGYEGSSGMDNRLAYLRTLSPTKLKLVLSELNAILGINEAFDVSKMKAKDTIELKNTRTGAVGKYTIKRIFGGSSNIKEIEVLNRSNQPLTLYYSKGRGLQNFKGDVYEYITQSRIGESVLKEDVDATIKKLENLIKSQFTIIDFKAPAKRTSSNEEFLMVKVKDDKYGGPESGLGKVIKKHTGVEASFIDNYGNDKVYWVSLEKIENSPVSGINENFPGVGETVDAKDINSDMKSYFNRTNRKLEITTKDNKKANGSVNKFYNDLIFATKEKWDIPVKDILKVKILEKIENSPISGINESAMGDVDQMAKDASTFNQFAMEFFKEYPNIKQDEKMGFVKWLKTVYMDARRNK